MKVSAHSHGDTLNDSSLICILRGEPPLLDQPLPLRNTVLTHPHVRRPWTSVPTPPTCALNDTSTFTLVWSHAASPLTLIVLALPIDTALLFSPPRSLCHMEAYNTSLLRSIRQAAAASDPLATTLLKRWDDQFTPEVLTQATLALGDLWNTEAAGVCNALRWGVLHGHLQYISSVGAVLVPRGILLHCSATYAPQIRCSLHRS